jgi:3-oxoadipyl-CoA thiolase
MDASLIIDAVRTPIGNLGGGLSPVRPDDLAAVVLKALMERNHLLIDSIDEVILGCANQAGEDNRDIGRMAALLAGLSVETAGLTVNRLCASGLSAVTQAARAIKCGEAQSVLAGGVESMSRAPYSFPKAEKGFPFGNLTAWDTALGWRYPNPILVDKGYTISLGETAENIADQYQISREEQDKYALQSHQRAINAIDAGKFNDEIIPVRIPQKKGDLVIDRDERPRRDSSLQALAALKSAFREHGTVTAGNSSGMNDGAAAVLIVSQEFADRYHLKPLARVVASASVGVDPRLMGLGPVPATNKALKQANLSIQQIGLVELNEAFAVQALAVMHDLKLDAEKTNANGGAIALGHPLGCSGARILTTLIHEMKRRAGQKDTPRPYYGLVTLCVGVGQGESMIVEWVGE